MSKLNKKGFTLIELLVVIAIIGILASIVIVSLSSARNKAYRASALSTVSALGTEFVMCADDHNASNVTQLSVPADDETGTGVICQVGGAAAVGHTVEWPTLINTNGYCYSSANNACAALVVSDADLAKTIYLYNANNVLITCTWDGSAGYVCS